MTTKHAKSQCRNAKIHRLNRKRRQCSTCKKTWTMRPKKRGQRERRRTPALLARVLLRGHRLNDMAQYRSQCSPQNMSYHFRRSLHWYTSRPCRLPRLRGPLVFLTDGIWFRFKENRWVLYLAALKPCCDQYAIFLDPLLLPGYETVKGWKEIIQSMPLPLKRRIRAWVSDDLRGVKTMAQQTNWVLQLCHFHLISQLQARRGHWKKGIPTTVARESLYRLIRRALRTRRQVRADRIVRRLENILAQNTVPTRLRMIVWEFIRNMNFYRSYRHHPELHLPLTTNSMEAMGSRIRDMLRRAKNLRTPESLLQWVTAFIRLRRKITCNGYNLSTD